MNDIKYYLVKYINSIDDLKNFCMQDKSFYNICKTSQTSIAKHFLDIYNVDYTDPNNFIYKYHNKNISEYFIDSIYNLPSIFKLYMKTYYLLKINCNNMIISSIPILPNMTQFYGDNNKLTTFPIQPNMTLFHASYNLLKTFPVQPRMTHFIVNNNKLISFPVQPNMIEFIADNNQLTSFLIQPKMIDFYADNNLLTTFPIQPQMELFMANNNQITTFPIQPNLHICRATNNPLDFCIEYQLNEDQDL